MDDMVQLERILLDNLKAILASNISSTGMRAPWEMTIDDIEVNRQLAERLCNADGAVRALLCYPKPDHVFVLRDDTQT